MDDEIEFQFSNKCIKTYSKTQKNIEKNVPERRQEKKETEESPRKEDVIYEKLSTKQAVTYLLNGTLKNKVCRYCLHVSSELFEVEQMITIAKNEVMYTIPIMSMVASFHPFKMENDPEFPDKICNRCLDRTINCYLFSQQCDQAERALKNCLEDMYEKLSKLDPLDRIKKRGRQKRNPNHNILYAENNNVIDYAEPSMQLISTTQSDPNEALIKEFECLKCAQVLPNLVSLLNHSKSHPKSMWFNCRLCGKSFPKLYQLKKHFREVHYKQTPTENEKTVKLDCNTCGVVSENYHRFLQHREKHRFKNIMEDLLDKGMDSLCSVCFNKETKMMYVNDTVCLHGGFPELTGDRSMTTILSATVPEITTIANYAGSKICEKCCNDALSAYLFRYHANFYRNRLNTCISLMLDNLNKIKEPKSNLCIEIAQETIMPSLDPAHESLLVVDESLDESNFPIDVLEDEFRIESEESGEEEIKIEIIESRKEITPVKQEVKVESKPALLNGCAGDVSEFLTFNKKKKVQVTKLTCPLCSKHFISDYFLKRHILKHLNKNIYCEKCNEEFKSKFHLFEHNKHSHLIESENFKTCKICGRTFLKDKELRKHERRHIYKKCQLCDKSFKTQYHFEIHMQRHSQKLKLLKKKRIQNCSFCEKECANDNELSLHVNKVHLQIKPYNCDMCDQHFYTEYNLKYHKKLHSLHTKERCTFCNKTLYSRKQLVIHIRKHIGVMPFTCQMCDQSFFTQANLKTHLHKHFSNN